MSIIYQLQKDVVENYLPSLEKKFGPCQDEGHCIEEVDGVYRLRLPQKDICLPYTSCGFYRCMEEKYNCMDYGVNYFKELAFPTCSQYVSNIKDGRFTQEGVDWIFSVMVCLQKGLVSECDLNENCEKESPYKTCNHITKFTLDFHPSCYINSSVGVCNLPWPDKLAIWETVAPYLTKEEKRQAWKVIWFCVFS